MKLQPSGSYHIQEFDPKYYYEDIGLICYSYYYSERYQAKYANIHYCQSSYSSNKYKLHLDIQADDKLHWLHENQMMYHKLHPMIHYDKSRHCQCWVSYHWQALRNHQQRGL